MSEAHEVVQASFDTFKRKIIEINYLQGITKSIYQKHLQDLDQRTKNEQDLPYKSSRTINFWLYNIGASRSEYCESNEFNTQKMFDLAAELFNKQYQILLVDAYEAFEKYLKTSYIELSKTNTEFYIKQFHDKNSNNLLRFDSLRLLKKLHAKTPQIEMLLNIRNEQNSKLPNNERTLFLIALIEKLRHHIVHAHGFAIDKQKSINDILKKIGISNDQRHVDEFDYYFGINLHSNRICLLEVYDSEVPLIIDTYDDRLNSLIRHLVSYTKFINGYILNHLKQSSPSTHTQPLAAPSA